MRMKWIGAMMVILGCGGMGFIIAAASRREEGELRQLITALDYMECELQYHLTPLPELCRQAGREAKGTIQKVMMALAGELDSQISPDVESCLRAAVSGYDIPKRLRKAFEIMGSSLGRFDMEGQVKGLEVVRIYCRRELDAMTCNRETRLRSYQTLGLCAGAALAILFV